MEAKLEAFCIMAKSSRGRAAAGLVQEATSAPGLFVFGELLDMPNIKEVKPLRKPLSLLRQRSRFDLRSLLPWGRVDAFALKATWWSLAAS